jgi:outer membrane protein TolC
MKHLRDNWIKWLAFGGLLSLASCTVPDAASLWLPKERPVADFAPIRFEKPSAEIKEIEETPSQPLVTSIRDAALLALQHNPSFQMERMSPAIRQAYEAQARASFDPVFSADLSLMREYTDSDSETGATRTGLDTRDLSRSASAGLTQALPTGTSVSLSGRRDLGNTRGDRDNAANYDNLSATSSGDVKITQALLQGFGPAVNLASLRQARLDTRISRYELESAAETLIYQTEAAGWEYLLAGRQIEIYQESLKISEDQLSEARERIRVGALADIELAAFEAEVAQRKEELINARSSLAKTRLEVMRLLGQRGAARWSRELTLTDTPEVPTDKLAPLEQHVEVALKQRPDLNEARLRIDRGELDLVRTRNGLLPKLDFFITLGGSRYASSFGSSNKDDENRSHSIESGLSLEYALGNRSERAAHARTVLSVQQTREALRNQEDLAQVDVRTAYLEVQRTFEQIDATQATRKHREEALRSETEKFRVGKSTGILVAQAQRDLMASRISEIGAVVAHLKARLSLYLQEGSLLERRGIALDSQ